MEMISKKYKYAVVGVSSNPEKYGHKVYRDFLENGYPTYPINPKLDVILGNEVYKSINDTPAKPDVVIFVVPPEVTLEVLREVQRIGITKVWMQPGSESIEAINFCLNNDIECIHDACIMIERKKLWMT